MSLLAAVDDDQVGDAVAVEIGEMHGVGRQHAILSPLLESRGRLACLER